MKFEEIKEEILARDEMLSENACKSKNAIFEEKIYTEKIQFIMDLL